MPPRNFLVLKRKFRIDHITTDHALRLGEVMLVVATRP
jgi:hypothetical protein